MDETINKFIKKFNYIRSMGYVKSVNNYASGIGLTFESLIGKTVDSFPLPDFDNLIEIKTKLAFSTKPVHLFKLAPEGNSFSESKRIFEKYAYIYKKKKIFYGCVNSNNFCKIGYTNYFNLKVNYKEEKLLLYIYDKNKKLIDNSSFWKFSSIENALFRKLKYLALIEVWSTQKCGLNYYKYYKCSIYKLSNFYNFLYLVENGIISINFSMDTIFSNNNYKIHDHGTSFDIKKEDLEKLFFKIY